MSPIDERLKTLGIVLPDVMPPVVDGYVPAFAPFIRSGPCAQCHFEKTPATGYQL